MKSLPILALLLPLLPPSIRAFVAPAARSLEARAAATLPPLLAKKGRKKNKNKRGRSGEGFGKPAQSPSSAVIEESAVSEGAGAPRALWSMETPSAPDTPPSRRRSPSEELGLDPDLSDEQRSEAILRRKFGLKSYEEQQADAGDYRALMDAEKKKEKRDRLRDIEKVWPEDKNLLEVLPPGLIKGIDSFLKLGLGLTTTAFVVAGVLITVEAGYKATGEVMPEGFEEFILHVVQPNFTPGLGVLLAFSVSLGVFSVTLGGSASSTYRENP